MYPKGWSIEVFFQSIKQRGFHLEAPHLTDPERLRKLFALVAITFALCLHIGQWAHTHRKPIPLKNHGYKANSFFRHGLECFRETLRRTDQWIDRFLIVIQQAIEQNLLTLEKILM